MWAKDEHDEEFFNQELLGVAAEQKQVLINFFEQHYGELAREILAGRNKVLANKKRELPLKAK